MNIKVFNLALRNNETWYIWWHEACACKCKLDVSGCNDKQHWNSGKCRCERKELIDTGRCDDEFTWNPSSCACECDRSSAFSEYLNYVRVV